MQLRSVPSALEIDTEGTAGGASETANHILGLRQRLAVSFDLSIMGYCGAQSSHAFGHVLGHEILGLQPAYFLAREPDFTRANEILAAVRRQALPKNSWSTACLLTRRAE